MSFPSPSLMQMELTPSLAPNPPLLNLATGQPPDFFLTDTLAFAFCIFDSLGIMADLTNIKVVTVDFLDDPVLGNRLGTLAVSSGIVATVAIEDWRAQIAQQVLLQLNPGVITGLNFTAPTQEVWMVVQAVDSNGIRIVLGAGWVTVRTGVPIDVRLPLLPIPSIIPLGTTYYIPAGVTITFPTAPQILGSLICAPASGSLPAGSFIITAN